ncbi:hypothetical protein BDW74DRAFT_176641 [Aspergillus multicolor]|uniref:uncharacterized protein n=1 Tax=Aspergillus multicolor TaxID=41759 RepID=UPI003CCD0226
MSLFNDDESDNGSDVNDPPNTSGDELDSYQPPFTTRPSGKQFPNVWASYDNEFYKPAQPEPPRFLTELAKEELENDKPRLSTTEQAKEELKKASRESVANTRSIFEKPGGNVGGPMPSVGEEGGFAANGVGGAPGQNAAPKAAAGGSMDGTPGTATSSSYGDAEFKKDKGLTKSEYAMFAQPQQGPKPGFQGQDQAYKSIFGGLNVHESQRPSFQVDSDPEDDLYSASPAKAEGNRPESVLSQDGFSVIESGSEGEYTLNPSRGNSPKPQEQPKQGSDLINPRPTPPPPRTPADAKARKEALDKLNGITPPYVPPTTNDPVTESCRDSNATFTRDAQQGFHPKDKFDDDDKPFNDFGAQKTPRASTINPKPTPKPTPTPTRAPAAASTPASPTPAPLRPQLQPQRTPAVAKPQPIPPTTSSTPSRASRAPGISIEEKIKAEAKARVEAIAQYHRSSVAPSPAPSTRSRRDSTMSIEDEVRAAAAARKAESRRNTVAPSRATSASTGSSSTSGWSVEDEIRAAAAARAAESWRKTATPSQPSTSRSSSRASRMSIEEQVIAATAAREEEKRRGAPRRSESISSCPDKELSIEEQIQQAVEGRGEVFSINVPGKGKNGSTSNRMNFFLAKDPNSPSSWSRNALRKSISSISSISSGSFRGHRDRDEDSRHPSLADIPERVREEEEERMDRGDIKGSRHWNPYQVEIDEYSVNGSESGVHPALWEQPYLRPSRSTLKENKPPSRRASVASPPRRTNPEPEVERTTCLTLDNLCVKCTNGLADIDPAIPAKYLQTPRDIHPVVIETILNGTIDEAAKIIESFHESVIRLIGQHFPIHAAVRRSQQQKRAGHWYDITSGEGPAAMTCRTERHYDRKADENPGLIKSLIYSPYAWAKRQEKKKNKHVQATHVKLRDFVLLLDLPFQIENNGMIENKIREYLPKNVTIIRIHSNFRGDLSLFRLMYWEWTHNANMTTTPLRKGDRESRTSSYREHSTSRTRANDNANDAPPPSQLPSGLTEQTMTTLIRSGLLPKDTSYDEYCLQFVKICLKREGEITNRRLGIPEPLRDTQVPRAPAEYPPTSPRSDTSRSGRGDSDRRKTQIQSSLDRLPSDASSVSSLSSASSTRRRTHYPAKHGDGNGSQERRPSESSSHSYSHSRSRDRTQDRDYDADRTPRASYVPHTRSRDRRDATGNQRPGPPTRRPTEQEHVARDENREAQRQSRRESRQPSQSSSERHREREREREHDRGRRISRETCVTSEADGGSPFGAR